MSEKKFGDTMDTFGGDADGAVEAPAAVTSNPLAGLPYDANAIDESVNASGGGMRSLLPAGKYEATVVLFLPNFLTKNGKRMAVLKFITDTVEGVYDIPYFIYKNSEKPVSEGTVKWFWSDMKKINEDLRKLDPATVVQMVGGTPECMKGKKFTVTARQEEYAGRMNNKFFVEIFDPAAKEKAAAKAKLIAEQAKHLPPIPDDCDLDKDDPYKED